LRFRNRAYKVYTTAIKYLFFTSECYNEGMDIVGTQFMNNDKYKVEKYNHMI